MGSGATYGLISTLCAAATLLATTMATADQERTADAPAAAVVVTRAVEYLSREVPAWRREHPCFSCHNNGDAARALVAADRRGRDVRAALTGTLDWLARPDRWHTNGGGEGGADDKQLARIQFAHATATAAAADLVPAPAVVSAAKLIAADQQRDGSWRLDASDSIGSPATYGTALATALARRTLVAAATPEMSLAADRAATWLRTVPGRNMPDAAAIIFTFDESTPNRRVAEELIASGQGRDGGWGPYATSPAEVFDTALALLALDELSRRAPVSSERAAQHTAIVRGRDYLARQQLADGSWPETTRPSGQTSYAQRISTTAWALLAMLETDPARTGRIKAAR